MTGIGRHVLPRARRTALIRAFVPLRMRISLRRRRVYRKLHEEEEGLRPRNEPELLALESLIQPGMTVVDVGANVGRYAVRMSRLVGATGRVWAFEPVPATREILEYVLRRFRATNVSVRPVALSDQDGVVEMVVPECGGPLGYRLGFAHFAHGVPERGVRVVAESRRFDEEWAGGRIDFVKCDVEGAELRVFMGMSETLARHHPTILVEIEERHIGRFGSSASAVFSFLRQFGYHGYTLIEEQFQPCECVCDGSKNYLFRSDALCAEEGAS
jgi:FkbM family methyltransferase